MEASTVIIRHPNREKPQSKATKAVVVLLLLASAGLILVVAGGGWSKLEGAQMPAVAWGILYAVMAYFVLRWNRGVLPLASGLAIIFISMLIVAAPAWFARDKPGLEEPALPPALLGLLVLVLIGVQILLIVFAMQGFTQKWNIEVEVSEGGFGYEGEAPAGEGQPPPVAEEHGVAQEAPAAETPEQGQAPQQQSPPGPPQSPMGPGGPQSPSQ